MNGGRNYNGPKVKVKNASLSKIWLYAGKSEYPPLLVPSNRDGNNARGADNPQERPDRFRMKGGGNVNQTFVRPREKGLMCGGGQLITGYNHFPPYDGCPSRQEKNRFGILRDCTPDSKEIWMKIQSGLHGDMQRVAETTISLRSERRTEEQQERAKFLVG